MFKNVRLLSLVFQKYYNHLLIGSYSSLNPCPLFLSFVSKCIKTLLPVDIRLDGRLPIPPQYFPIIGDALELPSYILKESCLKLQCYNLFYKPIQIKSSYPQFDLYSTSKLIKLSLMTCSYGA